MLTINNFSDHTSDQRAIFIKPSGSFLSSFISNSGITNVQFMIDNSGSMGDRIRNSSYSKHTIVKQSLLSVLDYFLALSLEGHLINCSFSTFNLHLNHLSIDQLVGSDTITQLKHNINLIQVSGGTDISNALEYCNQWLYAKSLIEKSTNMVIFITDGYHSQKDEIPELLDNFCKCDNSNYYSIGLGVSGDYDHELMGQLFKNFTGCSTAESASDSIIRSAFTGTSTILKDVQIKFSGNVSEIKTSLNKINDYYVIDKIDLSTKIPFYFKVNQVGNTCSVTGVTINGDNIVYMLNLDENITNITHVNLFGKYFELEQEYLKIIEHSESQISCKLQLEALNVILGNITKHNGLILEDLLPFYENLITKVKNFMSNVEGVHVTQLNDTEFKHWLNLGSIAIRHASINVVVPQLSRQTSVSISQNINRGQSLCSHDIRMPNPLPLRRGLRYMSMPTEPTRTLNPLSHTLSIISEESICKICYVNPIQVLTLPCKHVTSCMDCVRHMNECPICRVKVESGKELKVGSKCCKCKIDVPNILFLPCSHVVVCENCVTKKTTSTCNKCGNEFGSYCKLFV